MMNLDLSLINKPRQEDAQVAFEQSPLVRFYPPGIVPDRVEPAPDLRQSLECRFTRHRSPLQ